MTLLAFFAFLSGIVTILSPCILPVLPLILTGSIGGKSKPLGIIAGFIGSFSLFTLALSALVQTLSVPASALRVAAVIIIGLFGLTLALPSIQNRFEMLASRLVKSHGNSRKSGFSGGLLTGISLGLVWTPCVGPIMASVITLAVSRQVDGGAVLIIGFYSLGTSLPMLALMAGGRKLLARFPRLTARTSGIQRIFGIIMIGTALMIGLGADRRFQTFVLDAFPRYGTGLTAFENIEPVRKALDSRKESSSSETGFSWKEPPRKARLGDYGTAPPLIAEGPWLNRESPLSMEELRGKVVLVDFWTYSCVNCVRTLPYLRDWYDKYAEYGLEIIGVHSPEFPFERNIANVEKAMEDLQIDWPVVLDNDFSQWRAYANRFWPAHFFIDGTGQIRYFHFGEGSYEKSEEVILKLLRETGSNPEISTPAKNESNLSENRTPEIYLGYERSRGFLTDKIVRDGEREYTLAENPGPGEWSLAGEWIVRNDFIEIDGQGELELLFKGRNLFLVLEPMDRENSLQITIDGAPFRDTADVQNGILKPEGSRLYRLAEGLDPSEHLLALKVQGHIRLYAFTFG